MFTHQNSRYVYLPYNILLHLVGCIWQKPVPTYASTVYSVQVFGVGEFGEMS